MKKKRALFMTVGTGVGPGTKEERRKNLAHGLLKSVELCNPDKIVFFVSEESKETVRSLRSQYRDKKKKDLENYKFVELKKIDDFYECYTKIEEESKKKKDHEIFVDYTSGSKTMSISAAIYAMLYRKGLILVGGKRGEEGLVMPGMEAPGKQNIFAAYNKYLLDKVKGAFNLYRFGEARKHLTDIVGSEEKKETYDKLVQAYDLWDKFEHEKAFQILRDVKDERTNDNKKFLGQLSHAREKENFLLADLLNNAKRRLEEGKYDDAVARLYRAIEFMGQIKLLKEHRLDASNIDPLDLMGRLEEEKTKKYEKYKDEDGKIKLPLSGVFELLRDLNDDLGKKYSEDEKLKDLLGKRNNSILGHGNMPVDEKDAEKFFGVVKEYKKSFPELDEWVEKSKFAHFNEI